MTCSLRRVHRATVARWIADVRAKILAETRRSLARRLDAPTGELDSVLPLLCSQLEQTLHRFLAAREDHDAGGEREQNG